MAPGSLPADATDIHQEGLRLPPMRLTAEVRALLLANSRTPIERAGPFYRAEDYHQDYYLKNPVRYKYYRLSCGRDNRLAELWAPARH